MKAHFATLRIAAILVFLTFVLPVCAQAQRTNEAEGITQQQADQMLAELKQIRALLESREKANAKQALERTATDDHAKLTINGGYSMGEVHAPVTLVEFADYQCPFCKHFHETAFPELRKNYIDTGKLRFIALDLPLDAHNNAMKAAAAALCAGEQYKFWEMRDLLISHADKLDEGSIFDYANRLQLDTSLLKNCLASDRYAAKIKKDMAQAEAAGISGTPSFVLARTTGGEIEGTKIVGAMPYAEFDSKIKQVLRAGGPP